MKIKNHTSTNLINKQRIPIIGIQDKLNINTKSNPSGLEKLTVHAGVSVCTMYTKLLNVHEKTCLQILRFL